MKIGFWLTTLTFLKGSNEKIIFQKNFQNRKRGSSPSRPLFANFLPFLGVPEGIEGVNSELSFFSPMNLIWSIFAIYSMWPAIKLDLTPKKWCQKWQKIVNFLKISVFSNISDELFNLIPTFYKHICIRGELGGKGEGCIAPPRRFLGGVPPQVGEGGAKKL